MYVMFTVRKLMLTSRVNELQYRMMQISRQRIAMTQYAGAIADGKVTQEESMFQTKDSANRILDFQTRAQLTDANGNSKVDMETQNYLAQLQADRPTDARLSDPNFQPYLNDMIGTSMLKELAQEESDKIAQEDKVLQMEQQMLQTELDAAMKELESVEKAETKGIEMATPKYGGSQ